MRLPTLIRRAWPIAILLGALALSRLSSGPFDKKPPDRPTEESEYRLYRVSQAAPGDLVESLKAKFAGRGARFAIEPQTSQLIVVADASVQGEVASLLNESNSAGAIRSQPGPSPIAPGATVGSPTLASPTPSLTRRVPIFEARSVSEGREGAARQASSGTLTASNPIAVVEPALLSPEPLEQPSEAVDPTKTQATIIPLAHKPVAEVAHTLYEIAESRLVGQQEGPSGLPGFAFLAEGPATQRSVEAAGTSAGLGAMPTQAWACHAAGEGERVVQVGVDEGSNSLFVVAPAGNVPAIRRLVGLLDTPSGGGQVVEVARLGRHRSERVAAALQPLLAQGSQSDDRPGQTASTPGAPSATVGPANRAAHTARQASSGTPAAANQPRILRLGHEGPEESPVVLAQNQPPASQPNQPPPSQEQPPQAPGAGLLGNVEVQSIPGFEDILILRGSPRDVQEVQRIINEIMRLSAETAAEIRIVPLENVGSESLAETLSSLYGAAPTQAAGAAPVPTGGVTILPLVKPNAVLIQAPRNRMEQIVELVRSLDQPVPPTAQFQVFALKHATAATAQQVIEEFFADRAGLGTRAIVRADLRSNTLLVYASPRDLAEVAAMIARLDVPDAAAVNELRQFRLTHALADDMARILNQAITSGLTPPGLTTGAGAAGGPTPAGGAQAVAAQAGTTVSVGGTASTQLLQPKSSTLNFITVDEQGRHSTRSGILTDVRVTSDPRTNSVLVSAPAESMELMAELIQQLDAPPSVVAEVKVFTLEQGDAESMGEMLGQLFGQVAAQQQQPGVAGAPLLGAAEGETTLVPLRITVDARSNSIIAAGSAGDLRIVEAILVRLDLTQGREYQTQVVRLRNSPASLVAQAITQFFEGQRRIEQTDPELVSAFERFEREVVVIPEEFTNSLVISATQKYLDTVLRLIEQLDQDEPQVVIQVLLAEVTLGNTDEFGVELGIQDSLLFNRSVPQLIPPNVANTLDPGFLFNSTDALGNLAGTANPDRVGGQGLSNFALGRANGELGFGGLVLSASSESVSVLLRALAECRRLDILSRPQVMTYNNQPAMVQVGQLIQIPVGTVTTAVGATTETEERPIGLILLVRPRIRPDGVVVMEVDAEKSSLRPLEEGIPILTTTEGEVVRTPVIDRTIASTVVSAADGQTVVIGGLITKRNSHVERKVPFVGDLPILGIPFRFDQDIEERTELLIILTPRVVRNPQDADLIKQVEARRMNWILRDVVDVHGDIGVYEDPNDCENCGPNATIEVVPQSGPLPEAAPAGPEPIAPTPATEMPLGGEAYPPASYSEPTRSPELLMQNPADRAPALIDAPRNDRASLEAQSTLE